VGKIALSGISKSFGNVMAVDDVSLEVQDKEFLVLLGPSGCGKTTLLRCIAGLEIPDKGKIWIGERLVNELYARDRDVAMVFQSYALYPHMSVYDNIAFPLRMRNMSKQETDDRVKKTAGILRIVHLLNRKPKQLSGGEQQRVALGRAIVREPKAFLMDEPLSNLDAKLRLYMRAELKRLQKELGITTVYVTHDQAEAMTMADRIAVMNQGHLLQLATPERVYDSPSTSFVAGFLGSPPMNFIDCSLSEKDGKTALVAHGFILEAAEFANVNMENIGTELKLGVRPEHMMVSNVRTSAEAVEGEVYVVEPLGSEVILDLKVQDDILKARSPPGLLPSLGDKVWLTFQEGKVHIFDARTEKVIVVI
jgi:multiple sugar transport system ATP-binding protein